VQGAQKFQIKLKPKLKRLVVFFGTYVLHAREEEK